MSTSNRMQFRVSALRAEVARRHAEQTTKAQAEHDEAMDHDGRVDRWRIEQTKKVRALANGLRRGAVSDRELADFSTKWIPHDERDRAPGRLTEAIEKADGRRDQALRRLDAIRAHVPEGETEAVLDLTPTMARDWFGI